jgi:hypothetical protein
VHRDFLSPCIYIYIYISPAGNRNIIPWTTSRQRSLYKHCTIPAPNCFKFHTRYYKIRVSQVPHIQINSTRRKQLQELVNTRTLKYGLVEALLYSWVVRYSVGVRNSKKCKQSEAIHVSYLFPGNQDHISVIRFARVLIHKTKTDRIKITVCVSYQLLQPAYLIVSIASHHKPHGRDLRVSIPHPTRPNLSSIQPPLQ